MSVYKYIWHLISPKVIWSSAKEGLATQAKGAIITMSKLQLDILNIRNFSNCLTLSLNLYSLMGQKFGGLKNQVILKMFGISSVRNI